MLPLPGSFSSHLVVVRAVRAQLLQRHYAVQLLVRLLQDLLDSEAAVVGVHLRVLETCRQVPADDVLVVHLEVLLHDLVQLLAAGLDTLEILRRRTTIRHAFPDELVPVPAHAEALHAERVVLADGAVEALLPGGDAHVALVAHPPLLGIRRLAPLGLVCPAGLVALVGTILPLLGVSFGLGGGAAGVPASLPPLRRGLRRTTLAPLQGLGGGGRDVELVRGRFGKRLGVERLVRLVVLLVEGLRHRLVVLLRVEVCVQDLRAQWDVLIAGHLLQLLQPPHDLLLLQVLEPLQLFGPPYLLRLLALGPLFSLALSFVAALAHRAFHEALVPLDLLAVFHLEAEVVLLLELVLLLQVDLVVVRVLLGGGLHGHRLFPSLVHEVVPEELLVLVQVVALEVARHVVVAGLLLPLLVPLAIELVEGLLLSPQLLGRLLLDGEKVAVVVLLAAALGCGCGDDAPP
mmetsp:Transcript_51725/g.149132  ORF Transcript_51725/g.149132 Transcript_51725/m.149132 type:complete len:460 (-) Transcript_51725:592-1971(-)